jgi:hypothetical protein
LLANLAFAPGVEGVVNEDRPVQETVVVGFQLDELERRQVWVAGVTAHPDGPWVTQQACKLASALNDGGRRIRFFIRDRDSKFVDAFDEVFGSEGLRVKTPVRCFDAGLSTYAGGLTTGDLGVSPDRTHTGWLP